MSSYEGGVSPITRIAAADFSDALYKLAVINSSGLAALAASATAAIAGVIGMNAASGEAVPVNPLVGRLKVKAGGAITAGQLLVPDASGTVTGVADISAIPANAMSIGIALSDADSGDVFDFWAQPMVSPANA